MKIIKKYYSKKDNLFYVEFKEGLEHKIKRFRNFKRFSRFLNNDISDADLFDYDFNRIDLLKYNIENAGISSSVLKRQGIFNNDFYENNINSYNSLIGIDFHEANEVTEIRDMLVLSAREINDNNDICISYITDLHLDYKIKKKFHNYASKQEIIFYIKNIVQKLKQDFYDSNSDILLIGGDISYSFSISEIFYNELRKEIKYEDIYVVLGNHEFWDISINEKSNLDNISSIKLFEYEYRSLLDNLKIDLIYNELLILNNSESLYSYTKTKLTENEILDMSIEEIKEACKYSFLAVLGGVGFSGYSKVYNASFGLYKNAIRTLENDLVHTKIFESIYQKCKESLSNKNVLVFTHMPKDNWSRDTFCSNWIYVNGHTHHNYFKYCDDKKIYADNQIGYSNLNIRLKHFHLSKNYDMFSNYADGIYEIEKRDYIYFYRAYNISINYNRKNIKTYMLKKDGIYCFIQQNLNNGNLYLLSGGAIKKLEYQNDMEYYYNNLVYYAQSVEYFMSNYNNKLKEISNLIKLFGGDGKIHGSIVDIDFFNHVYLNPFDGTITPYFAHSMTEKYVYKNIPSLLYYKCKYLYQNFVNLLNDEKNKHQLIVLNNNIKIVQKNTFVKDTDIYRYSRVAKNLQYITNIRVVRTWSYAFFGKRDTIDSNKLLIHDFIE